MLSFAEQLQLDCPRCGTAFRTEVWVTVDGHERPDLVARILDGSLHATVCPQCGQRGEVPAPLLYHDGAAQRVLLAVPPTMPESEWREAGQTLLWALIGALPDAQRRAYLGDVQAEAGLGGIAQIILAEQLAGLPNAVAYARRTPTDQEVPPLVLAIEALLAAPDATALQTVLAQQPMLREPQTITILRELAHAAFQADEPDAGTGFSRAADLLVELQSIAPIEVAKPPTPRPAAPADPHEEMVFALLRSQSGSDLAAVVDQYPELLEATSDVVLEQWAIQARLTGKARIADGLDERRAALAAMRTEYQRQQPILEAVDLLLNAATVDEVEAVIVERGELLTDEADEALARLEAAAEPELAPLIADRRALLQQVRAHLNE